MNNGATLTTYGNTDLRKGTEERPLVTFAVFAYNQDKYICEAVEAAFAQYSGPRFLDSCLRASRKSVS